MKHINRFRQRLSLITFFYVFKIHLFLSFVIKGIVFMDKIDKIKTLFMFLRCVCVFVVILGLLLNKQI
jgi:hypothetical protein